MIKMMKPETKPQNEEKLTLEERLEKLEQSHYELTENVYGALNSITYTLKKIKKDHYESVDDDLDAAIEEINDSIEWIGAIMEETIDEK